MKSLLKFAMPFAAALALCACAKNGATQKQFAASDFNGSAWELVSAASPKDVKIPDEKGRPVFVLFMDNSRVAGMSGVNRFNAPYKLEDKGDGTFKASFGPAAATLMAGPFLQFEQYFFKALSETDAIRVSGEIMEFADDGKVLLTFRRNDALGKN